MKKLKRYRPTLWSDEGAPSEPEEFCRSEDVAELEAENARLEAALTKAVDLLRGASEFLAPYGAASAADIDVFLGKHGGEGE